MVRLDRTPSPQGPQGLTDSGAAAGQPVVTSPQDGPLQRSSLSRRTRPDPPACAVIRVMEQAGVPGPVVGGTTGPCGPACRGGAALSSSPQCPGAPVVARRVRSGRLASRC